MTPTWIEVAQTANLFEGEVIAELLRSSNIPVYMERATNMMPAMFGHYVIPQRIYVPDIHYEEACLLLDDYDDTLSLDEPGIQL
jgi:hypothetical protein